MLHQLSRWARAFLLARIASPFPAWPPTRE